MSDVDDFLFELLLKHNDINLQTNVLKSLKYRTNKFGIDVSINRFDDFIAQSIEKIYKYNASVAVFREAYDPLEDGKHYTKRFYPLLIDELEFRSKLLLENIFKALRIAYPDDLEKKFFFQTYYYDLLSADRVRKDNATTVLEQILPKGLYLEIYDLFSIEDFANNNRERDFKNAAQNKYGDFDLSEEYLLKFLNNENNKYLKFIIIKCGEKKGDENVLETIDILNFLKKTELFKEVPGDILFLLAKKAQEKSYNKGEYILKRGEVVDSLFVVYKGKMDILIGDAEKIVAVTGEKEVLGEVELFRDVKKRYAVASIRAKSDDVICILIGNNDFDEVLETHIELARALIRSLGNRLEMMNERIQEIGGGIV